MIPSLPTEIIQQIIKSSLPPLKQSTHRERYDRLLTFIKVSSCWKELAEEELYKHIVIEHAKSLQLLLLLQEANSSIRRATETIRVTVVRHFATQFLDPTILLLNSRPETKEIWLIELPIEIVLSGAVRWSSFKSLESLYLINCFQAKYLDIDEFTVDPASFINLKQLTITNVIDSNEYLIGTLFKHSIIPKVKSFTFIETDAGASSLVTFDPLLLQQLETLMIYDRYGESESVVQRAFIDTEVDSLVLRTLVIRDPHFFLNGVVIPPSLATLLILVPEELDSDDMINIIQAMPSLHLPFNLKRLRFPTILPELVECSNLLIEECSRREINLEFEKSLREEDFSTLEMIELLEGLVSE